MKYVRFVAHKFVTFLHEYPIWSLSLLSCTAIIIILGNFFYLSQKINEELAMQYASLLTRSLEKLREEYNTNVTERVKSFVMVTDEYDKHAGAIPFPATFSIDLAEKISQGGKVTRIYSDFPFSSRKTGGPHDNYEVEALQALRQNPDIPFARIETFKGRRSLRYAKAIRLEASCVSCHNSRPDSPKKDWKVGDVRGAQEVILPLDSTLSTTLSGLLHTLGVMITLGLVGIGLLALVINKLRGSLRTVNALAQETAATNRMLLATNVAYNRFVPHEFLGFLDKESIIDVSLGDNIQQEMTILFSDIRSFTTISEIMTPQENFQFINTYLSAMGPIVRDYHGFIDKYIGDAIMALFKNANDAVNASIAMLLQLLAFNRSRESLKNNPIKIGIGLNTGVLMLGTIGEHNRMEGTVISDAVNLASRMEGMTKIYGTRLLISQYTLQQLEHPERYLIRIIDRVKVKGKSESVVVYEVFDGDPLEIREIKMSTKRDFELAFRLYQQREFQQAKEIFTACAMCSIEDQAAEIYVKRCEYYLQTGCAPDWDGVMQLEVK
jgi:class 3 adenylate cyclase